MSELNGADTQKTTDNKNAYETRIVAYADILGWGDATKDVTQFGRLQKAITSIAGHANSFSSKNKEQLKSISGTPARFLAEYNSIEFSYFSDCFAISAPVVYGQAVFKILSFASDALLHEQLLVRGGVALGDLYHRQGIIFGSALLEAVDIEENQALYPRFLCSHKLIEYLHEQPHRDEVLLQDCCKEWVVNIACGRE